MKHKLSTKPYVTLIDKEAIKSLAPGSGMSYHQFKTPEPAILQTFDSPITQPNALVEFRTKEMTGLCPLTSFPDQYEVIVSYVPHKKCVESKSAKHYFGAFRDYGGFIETIAQKIFDDWLAVTGAQHLKVDITMNPRGGVAISTTIKRGF